MAKERIGGSQHIASWARAKDGHANWLKVWAHNAHLVADALGRYSPYVLFHGDKRKTTALPQGAPADEVEMPPAPEPKNESEATDQHHDHEVMTTRLRFRVQLLDEDGAPRSGLVYTLAFGGKKVEKIFNDGKIEDAPDELSLDEDGILDVIIPDDKIPEANALLRVQLPPALPTEGEQTQGDGSGNGDGDGTGNGEESDEPQGEWLEWVLTIGKLNPIKGKAPDEWCIAGVQQRLNNLGFGAGSITGICDVNTRAALSRFQKKYTITEEEAEVTRFQTAMDIDKDNDPYPAAIPGTKTRVALEKLHDTEAKALTDKPKPPPRPTSPKPAKPKVESDDNGQQAQPQQETEEAPPPNQQEAQPEKPPDRRLAQARSDLEQAEAKFEQAKSELEAAMLEKNRTQFGGSQHEQQQARDRVEAASRKRDRAYRALVSARTRLRKLEGGS